MIYVLIWFAIFWAVVTIAWAVASEIVWRRTSPMSNDPPIEIPGSGEIQKMQDEIKRLQVVRRVDHDSRDVTDLPGLWSEEDVFQMSKQTCGGDAVKLWMETFGRDKVNSMTEDEAKTFLAMLAVGRDLNAEPLEVVKRMTAAILLWVTEVDAED